jgi:hypothetical protein
MAKPKCPKCEGGMFEATEFQPLKSKAPLHAICCINCGTVVGIHDFTASKLVREMAQGLRAKFRWAAEPVPGTVFGPTD